MCFSFRIVSGYALPLKPNVDMLKPNFTGGIYRRCCNRWGAGHAMATSNQRDLISDQIAGGETCSELQRDLEPLHRHFHLAYPQRHLQGPVQICSCHEMLPTLLVPARATVSLAQAKMAVRQKGRHPKL